MAPSKQTKLTDKAWPTQDGDIHADQPPSPECHIDLDSELQAPDDVLVTNKSLHFMLQALKTSLRSDLRQLTNELRKDIADIGGRTSHLKTKTEEICAAHNDVVDKLQRLEEEQTTLKHKLADIEDRSRRNNLRFSGITDAITTEVLPQYLKALCKALALALAPTNQRTPHESWTGYTGFQDRPDLPRIPPRTL
ncbi:Hypothetical predicted protein [Pelobates cultripes]|uniref:Uncharacterized protein n=1 Tax=Pelobates cultripes TaxID=61616 RepID=A0AAD1WE92_PELCU|nr:Hypothetical predicted protein [Pelobates cultripes]